MKKYRWIRQTKREFLVEHRRYLRVMRAMLDGLRVGCALPVAGKPFEKEVKAIDQNLESIFELLKGKR